VATRFSVWVYPDGGDLQELADYFRRTIQEIADDMGIEIWGDMPALASRFLLVRCIIPTEDETEAWSRVRKFNSAIRAQLKRQTHLHIIK
jgi:hypothetical protein